MLDHSSPTSAAFSPAVKSVQARKGSRSQFVGLEAAGGWPRKISPDLAAFVAAQTSVFLATASLAGQPYIQHRGGPAGFLQVRDDTTIGFADLSGNRQYITLGNLAENPKAHLFLMDYERRQRVKLWGEARVVDDDPALLASLMPAGLRARPEQAILFEVTAWDANCRQHIPQRFEAADVAAALALRDERIAELERQVAHLRQAS